MVGSAQFAVPTTLPLAITSPPSCSKMGENAMPSVPMSLAFEDWVLAYRLQHDRAAVFEGDQHHREVGPHQVFNFY